MILGSTPRTSALSQIPPTVRSSPSDRHLPVGQFNTKSQMGHLSPSGLSSGEVSISPKAVTARFGRQEGRQTYSDCLTYPSGRRLPATRSSPLPRAAKIDVTIKPATKKIGTAGNASIGEVALTPFIVMALGAKNAMSAISNAKAIQTQVPAQKTILNRVPKPK